MCDIIRNQEFGSWILELGSWILEFGILEFGSWIMELGKHLAACNNYSAAIFCPSAAVRINLKKKRLGRADPQKALFTSRATFLPAGAKIENNQQKSSDLKLILKTEFISRVFPSVEL